MARLRKAALGETVDEILNETADAARKAALTALARRGDGAAFLVVRIDEIINVALKQLAAEFVDARVSLQNAGILKADQPFELPEASVDASILNVVSGICLAASRAIAENADADSRQQFDDALRDCEATWRNTLKGSAEND